MICKNCGTEQAEGELLCTQCGASLADAAPEAEEKIETAVEETVVEEATVEEAVEEETAVEETVVEEATVEEAVEEETVAEETVVEEAPVEEAPIEEAPVCAEKKSFICKDRLFSLITGAANIIIGIVLLWLSANVFTPDLALFSVAGQEMGILDVLENVTEEGMIPLLFLLLFTYVPLVLTAFIYGLVRLISGIVRMIKKPGESKGRLTGTTLGSAAGIYAATLIPVLALLIFRVFIDPFTEILLYGPVSLFCVMIGVAGVISRATKWLNKDRMSKEAFLKTAIPAPHAPDKRATMQYEKDLRVMVGRNVFYYVAFGIAAGVAILTAIWLLTATFLFEGSLFDVVKGYGVLPNFLINAIAMGVEIPFETITWHLTLAAAVVMAVWLAVSLIVRLVFRAVEFFANVFVFGATAQDKIVLGKFLTSLCVKTAWLAVFVGICDFAAAELSLQEPGFALTAVFTGLFVLLLAVRIAYGILGKKLQYLQAPVYEAPAEESASEESAEETVAAPVAAE